MNVGSAARAVLAAVWARDLDISSADTLKQLADEIGVSADTVDGAIAAPDFVAAETDAAIAAGVFGSPFYAVGDELFWGQEKIDDVIDLARNLNRNNSVNP